MGRDLSELDVAVLMVDGICFAEHCCVVVLAVTTVGTKVPVGLWLGDTENKRVVVDLLADLVARGLNATDGLLVVIDGAKALAAAVDAVFGDAALVQRCTLHKRRNVADYLPTDQQAFVDRKLAKAFTNPDPGAGLRAARDLARTLQRQHPDAAASLREGLDEMFTVRRLGLSDRLARTLSCTNAVDDLDRPYHDPQRQALAGRADGQALVRRRHAQRRAQLPPRQRVQGHAHPCRRSPPPRPRACHTRSETEEVV